MPTPGVTMSKIRHTLQLPQPVATASASGWPREGDRLTLTRAELDALVLGRP